LLSIPFIILGLLAFSGRLLEWFPWLDGTSNSNESPSHAIKKT